MSEVEKSESAKKQEDWMNSKWRPMMGWMYMVVCICDFVIFPVLWSLVHTVMHTGQYTQWNPLTLQGAGLFHIAMGAILGIAAYGRTQEKLGDKAGATAGAPSFNSPTPSFGGGNTPLGGNSLSTVPNFNSAPTPTPGFSPAPPPAFGSSKPVAPPPAAQPEL